jgi:LAO/AO transport system kinase
MEVADLILVNKSEGEMLEKAKLTASQINLALHLFQERADGWTCKVNLVSALHQIGISDTVHSINQFYQHMQLKQALLDLRQQQEAFWFEKQFEKQLFEKLENLLPLQELKHAYLQQLKSKQCSAFEAASALTQALKIQINKE